MTSSSSATSSPVSSHSAFPSPPTAPLSVADYRDLLLNLKAQNATDLSSPSPPSSLPSPSPLPPSFSPSPIPSESSPSPPVSRLPVPSSLASKSFAEKKARLAAQAQQYKTLPTKRLHQPPTASATPPLQPSALPAPTPQSSRPSPPPAAPSRSLATGPLSPTRARPSGGFAFPSSSSSSAASSPTHASSSSSSDGSGHKSRSGIFGSHLPPISTESQRLTTAGQTATGSVNTLGSVLSPSTQQASAPVPSATRGRTSSAVSPRYPPDASMAPPPAPSSSTTTPNTGQIPLPSPRRPAKPAGLPAAVFSPSLQARLASHQPLVSPRRRTLDTSPSPRDGGSVGVESLQAEFEKLSAEWNEQKIATGAGGGGGLNASFSHGPSTRRVPATMHVGAADDSALSFSQRRQRVQNAQAHNQTLPTSPQRRLVERVSSSDGERPPAMMYPPVSQMEVLSLSAAGYVHARPPQSVNATLNEGSLERMPSEADVGLLDPFADGGEGLLDDEELNCSITSS